MLLIIVIVFIVLIVSADLVKSFLKRDKYSFRLLHLIINQSKTFKKGDQTVCLVGMIHVGKRSFYEKLSKRFNFSSKDSVTYTEGVSDNNKAAESTINTAYEKIAKCIGHANQKAFQANGMFSNQINADIDMSLFTEKERIFINKTERIMNEFGNVLSGDREVIRKIVSISKNKEDAESMMKEIDLIGLKEVFAKPEQGYLSKQSFNYTVEDVSTKNIPRIGSQEFCDHYRDKGVNAIIELRNQNLLNIILNSNHRYIVVPWGADHLKDIESFLLSEGFEEKNNEYFTSFNIPYAALMFSKSLILCLLIFMSEIRKEFKKDFNENKSKKERA